MNGVVDGVDTTVSTKNAQAGPSSPSRLRPSLDNSPHDTPEHSFDLPSLQPLSHDHPLLSAPEFDVDTFLLSRIYIPLEELRGELREYLAVLREELVQLINDDYEEFISLGTGLRGEGERLTGLQAPLNELGQEVEVVRDNLKRHQDAIQEKLDARASLREEKTLLDLLQRLFDTLARAESLLDSEEEDRYKIVQRAAGEYTQLVYLTDKIASEGCKIVDTVTPRIAAIKSRLGTDLAGLLKESLGDTDQKLKLVLKTYDMIEGWTEAAEVVRSTFRDFCVENINTQALLVPPTSGIPDTPMTPITPMISVKQFDFDAVERPERLSEDAPLASLYNTVLSQIESYRPLLSISEKLSPQFDLFAGVIWPEIAQAIMDRLGSVIFAAGRPDELHKNYTVTYNFISHLENLAPSIEAVKSARSSSASEVFERRWQLPVYFQLRWKSIVTALETSLAGSTTSSGAWSLGQSAAVSKALATTFADDVFLAELGHRFWRLGLQITSRYNTWLKGKLEECGNDDAGDEQALKLAASAVLDLDALSRDVMNIPRVKDSELRSLLTFPTSAFIERITEILSRRCTDSLKLVRSVASQFRAAPSRSTEITPSYFIPSILKPLHAFYTSRPALSAKYGEEWSTTIVDAVCTSYAGILAGVRKTEDLLRRHRKSKKSGFSLFGGNANQEEGAEEDRFKRQMQVDIEALAKDAKGLGVAVEGLKGWKELVEVVNRPPE